MVYYDGPQVLTLNGSRNSLWICVAINAEGYEYPIFCVQVLKDELDRYMTGHVDLLYLFKYRKAQDYRITDLAAETARGLLLETVAPKAEWFPAEGFFSRDHTEAPPATGRADVPARKVISVRIDGEWEFPELAAFSNGMSECYSFLYALDMLSPGASGPSERRIRESFEAYPWRGGASSLNFYSDLYKFIPANDRLDVESIKYASPGAIELRGNSKIFSELLMSVELMRRRYRQLKDAYNTLHNYLSRAKLLTASREVVRGSLETQDFVSSAVKILSATYGFTKTDVLYKNCEKNWIITAKVLMSYHRRFIELFLFYAEGRASLSTDPIIWQFETEAGNHGRVEVTN